MWNTTSREYKQKLISKYIDYIELEKQNKEIIIKDTYFRESFIFDMINNHKKYNTPLDIRIFEDEYGIKIPINTEIKTKEESREYYKKLKQVLGSDYKLNYYEIETKTLEDITFESKKEIEKIIRIIAIKQDKIKKDTITFGIITMDLSNIMYDNKQLYKGFFERVKEY